MACRHYLSKKGSVLLQLANLERFRERSLLAKSPKLNIESNFTSATKNSDSSKERFAGQNYWNSHNISQGRYEQHGFKYVSNKFGNQDNQHNF